jgi:catechol 2,3-dioxygenase-like lactoylglutathione lyase family enzyme
MLPNAQLVAFIASSDLDRSYHFYVDLLGLKVLDRSPYGLGLDSGGTELRVQAVAEVATAVYTALGWAVDDLDASVTALREQGIAFQRYEGLEQDDHDAWTAPDGTRVAWFLDPDANVLSLHHHP